MDGVHELLGQLISLVPLEHTDPVAEYVSVAAQHVCLRVCPDARECVLNARQQNVEEDYGCGEHCQGEPCESHHSEHCVVFHCVASEVRFTNHGQYLTNYGTLHRVWRVVLL